MKRLLLISVALVFPLVGMLPASEQNPRRQRNRPPIIDSFTSSSSKIEICPFFPENGKPEVRLVVNAKDPDGDKLSYEYSISEGILSGKEESVVWNLDGLPHGPHKVRVTVRDGKGGKVDAALTVITAISSSCDPPRHECPVVEVSCPAEMDKSNSIIFSAVVRGRAKPYQSVSFDWNVNAGRIVKGQHSHQIEVSTTGAKGFDSITATVQVGGFDPSCVTTFITCTTRIVW